MLPMLARTSMPESRNQIARYLMTGSLIRVRLFSLRGPALSRKSREVHILEPEDMPSAHEPEQRPAHRDGGEHRDEDAEREREGEALDQARTRVEEDHAGDERREVRIADRRPCAL